MFLITCASELRSENSTYQEPGVRKKSLRVSSKYYKPDKYSAQHSGFHLKAGKSVAEVGISLLLKEVSVKRGDWRGWIEKNVSNVYVRWGGELVGMLGGGGGSWVLSSSFMSESLMSESAVC
jgi:hypothetical protein